MVTAITATNMSSPMATSKSASRVVTGSSPKTPTLV